MTDIEWSRRRSKWPIWAAIGCLFVLTLLAPRAWQRAQQAEKDAARARRQTQLASDEARSNSKHEPALSFYAAPPAAMPELAAPVPSLPPLAPAPSKTPAYAGPMAFADDYVVVDDLPCEVTPTAEADELTIEQSVVDPAGAALAESFTLRPPVQSVLVRNTPAPKADAQPVVYVESLIKVRDALAAIVEEAKQRQAAIEGARANEVDISASQVWEPAAANPLRVRVESSDERLAMLPPPPSAPEPTPLVAALPTRIDPTTAPQPDPSLAQAPVAMEPPMVDPPSEPVLRHRPEALITQLEALTNVIPASDWAQQVLIRIDSLIEPAADETDARPMIRDLAVLSQQGFNDALAVKDASDQAAWLRTTRALDRRLPVWSLLADHEYMQQHAGAVYAGDSAGMLAALQAVAELTADSSEGANWREYLRINDLAGLTSPGGEDYDEQRRAVARDVLIRLEDPWLTKQQRAFLAQPAVVELARNLQPWASGEASVETLAAIMERYESTGAQRDAAAIAELRMRMKWSDDRALRVLADELNRHYRNANVRMAFTAELMNRLIPVQPADVKPVHSRIAGADVRGRSETQTQIHVRLLPDKQVWRFGLEARGKVNSQTRSLTWPARLRNASQMDYEARKLVLVNRYGIHVWPAEARAEGDTNLVGVDSTFAYVPVLGAIVEHAAREQHRVSRPKAVAQVKNKVRVEACERMDTEADVKLARLEQRLDEFVLEPIARFGLTAEPLEMSTTEERAAMRVRMANEHQLAAHTPRPSAPSDSLASFQLHQSVFNNGLRGLDLDGKRMTAVELHQILSEKFRRRAADAPDDLPRAAKVEFAAYDAIRVTCTGDRVELILKIKELRHGRDSIRGVGVHAFFRPEVSGLDMKLVRDGTLQFSGAHLRTGPRMVLHSVFGKLLPKDQEVPVLMAQLGEDPRFAGLMITQLVIDDGWVAVSLGPERPDRVVWRTHGVERR